MSGPAGVAARGGTMAGQPLGKIEDWSAHAGAPLQLFILSAHRHGLLPYTYFYLLRALGAPNRPRTPT